MIKKIHKYFEKQTQDRPKVYIIPSRHGFRFVAINFFLFLIAITYANNLALLITFIMVTFFILQMFSIHRIIQNFILDNANFSDDYINHDHLAYLNTNKDLDIPLSKYIRMTLVGEEGQEVETSFHKVNSPTSLQFKILYPKRGIYHFKRVKFYTYGPTKLFYVWRYFPLKKTVTIYPERKKIDSIRNILDQGERTNTGESEFEYHLRYNRGISSKRIDWKVYAKTDQLYAKKYSDHEAIVLDINFSSFQDEKENVLSYMSYLVDKYYHESIPFKLTLPNKAIQPSKGYRHFEESMEAISAF